MSEKSELVLGTGKGVLGALVEPQGRKMSSTAATASSHNNTRLVVLDRKLKMGELKMAEVGENASGRLVLLPFCQNDRLSLLFSSSMSKVVDRDHERDNWEG
jgi:hypothetical protein